MLRSVLRTGRIAKSARASAVSPLSSSPSQTPSCARPIATSIPRLVATVPPRLNAAASVTPVDPTAYPHFDAQPALDSHGRIPISPYDIAPLACTAPESPRGHIIVHPHTQLRPQETWPAALESVSPFVREMGERCKGPDALQGFSVSFSSGDARMLKHKPAVFPAWDPKLPKVVRPEAGDASEGEEFMLHVYEGNGKHAQLGPFSAHSLPEAKKLEEAIQAALASAPIPSARYPKKQEEAHIYVCTHGTRDCRCGVVGHALKDELQAQVRKHQLRVLGESSKQVKVFEIAHVGGHKWAANALVYPHGDWYGNLRVTDAPLLLRSALAPSTSRHDLTDQRERLVHWPRWRGRIGISAEKMRKVWDEWGGGTVETAVIAPRKRGATAAAAAAAAATKSATPSPAPSATPFNVTFRRHDGTTITAPATLGSNLKDVAKSAGIEEIEATCGGKCECATCHAYLSDGGDIKKRIPDAVLPPPSDEEQDMLDYAVGRKPSSRLTCQVVLTEELRKWFEQSGGVVQLSRY